MQAPVQVGVSPPGYRLPSVAHVGSVHLIVSNLDRSLAFYRDVIGLQVLSTTPDGAGVATASLGSAETNTLLLVLEQRPHVQPIRDRSRLGLYHSAFLLPSREQLASFVEHLQRKQVRFGASDHLYSEALYLVDPDGLSVEVYADRPRAQWMYDGAEIVGAIDPLNFSALLAVPHGPWAGAPNGTTIGHIHMYVGDLTTSDAFYRGALGLDLVTWRYPQAHFLSAGGYHHHVGTNTWAHGATVAGETDARLLSWQLVLPSTQDLEQLYQNLEGTSYVFGSNATPMTKDPWNTWVHLVTSTPRSRAYEP